MPIRFLLKLVLMGLAPLISVLFFNGEQLAFAIFTSLAAVVLDNGRPKGLPFPVFLMFFYAMQMMLCVMLANMPGPGGVALDLDDASDLVEQPADDIKTMSIVLAAHNEHQYMARTLASIYENTPAEVLKEIIVVDDASSPPLVTSMLDYPEIKIIRHTERRGLIKSKIAGGNAALGDSIMFLDAHVKPDVRWSEPLLAHMNINYKRVVVPLIPILNGDTWIPNNNAVGIKMMFDWSLAFNWFEDNNDLVPCMSGGLFGITQRWWHESGEYDGQMNMWGAENIEQSIRIWLCGGEIYVARDSRVAHVFRSKFPYSVNNTEIYINKVRTVETWFDEYKERYYQADLAARRFTPYMGDISERLKLKETLQCKPFSWYVTKFQDVFASKHMLPTEIFLLRDKETKKCIGIDLASKEHVEQTQCWEYNKMQQWTYRTDGRGLWNVGAKKCMSWRGSPKQFLFTCGSEEGIQDLSLKNGHVQSSKWCLPSSPLVSALEKCPDQFLQISGPFEMFASRTAIP